MTQTERHTPGPWEACEPGDYGDFDGHSRVICSTGEMPLRIAVVHWHDSPDWREENDANARLIAAAPELLEALNYYADQLCEGWCEHSPDCAHFDNCGGCLARRVAFKATGTSS